AIITTCTEVIERWGLVSPIIRSTDIYDAVAVAFRLRATAYAAVGQHAAALSNLDELERRCRRAKSATAEESVSWAGVIRGTVMESLGRQADAESAYESVVRRFGGSRNPAARRGADKAAALQERLRIRRSSSEPQL